MASHYHHLQKKRVLEFCETVKFYLVHRKLTGGGLTIKCRDRHKKVYDKDSMVSSVMNMFGLEYPSMGLGNWDAYLPFNRSAIRKNRQCTEAAGVLLDSLGLNVCYR